MVDFTGKSNNGYEFKQVIGSGGFGTVYEAYQPILKRRVAIKVINPQHANQPAFIRNFHVEAELVASLEHPHIVPLYDYWRDTNGAFLIMRWLSGGSLRQSIQQQPWDTRQTAKLLDQITAALAVAHRHRVVHRDIKPDNILLDKEGNAYLADFGIAKQTDLQTSKDDTGAGTIQYAAPEQFQRKDITAQTDVYSLGVMLYEILTGQHPFSGATPSEIVYKHLQEPLPDVTQVRQTLPTGVQQIIQDMTAKDPSQRYRDVRAVAVDFREALMQRPTASIKAQQPPTTTKSHVDDTPTLVDTSELENPYKGLRAFTEADVDDFYGRTLLVEHLLDRLSETGSEARFLAVVGPSGSGKSSVVKAGLLPMIRAGELVDSENWFITEMYPGSQPFAELEAALIRVAVTQPDNLLDILRAENGFSRAIKQILPDDDNSELVLVIDQFEELFTLVTDENRRLRFLDNLLEALNDARSRLRVVVTLRADFYDRPLQYRTFADLMRQRVETVLPLSNEELEAAVRQPAERLGVSFEPGLVQTIINEIGEQPGTLPLLQYALTELFERRAGRSLTLQAYQEIGGVVGALAKRAEDLYQALVDAEQDAARQLFLRLVTLGEGTEDTRRRVRLTEIANLSDAMQAVIDRYGESRLLTFDRDPLTRTPTTEVAHEALIRSWERLREWLDADRETLRLRSKLTQAAIEWDEAGHDAGFLARETRLIQFETLLENPAVMLNELEQQFLRLSIADREQREAESRKIARRVQNSQRAALVLAVMVLLAVGAGIFAGWTAINAQTESAFALTAQQQARSEGATAVAEANEAGTQVISAANVGGTAQAGRMTAVAESNNAELRESQALAAVAEAQSQLTPIPPTLTFAAQEAAAAVAAASTARAEEGLASTQLAEAVTAIAEVEAQLTPIPRTLTPLAETVQAGETEIAGVPPTLNAVATDVKSAQNLVDSIQLVVRAQDLANSGQPQLGLALALEASYIASPPQTQRVLAELAYYPGIIRRFVGESRLSSSISFNSDGSRVATAVGDILIWDTATGEITRRIDANLMNNHLVVFSPDGTQVISGSCTDNEAEQCWMGYIGVWDVETGENLNTFGSITGSIKRLEISPDGQYILTTSCSLDLNVYCPMEELIIWRLSDGEPVHYLQGHGEQIFDIAFSSDGLQVVAASRGGDDRLTVWDAITGNIMSDFRQHDYRLDTIIVSPDGKQVIASADSYLHPQTSQVTVWDLTDGTLERALPPEFTNSAQSIAVNSDGTIVASGGGDGIVLIWDVMSESILYRLAGEFTSISGISFSPDDISLIVSGSQINSDDSSLQLWDIRTQDALLSVETGRINQVMFSVDGKTILTVGQGRSNALALWNAETGERIRNFQSINGSVESATFSPDGLVIALAVCIENGLRDCSKGELILLNATTGERLQTLDNYAGSINRLEFSHNGNFLVSSNYSYFLGEIEIRDTISGDLLRKFINSYTTFDLSLDSQTIIIGQFSHTVNNQNNMVMFDIITGNLLRRFRGDRVQQAMFPPETQQSGNRFQGHDSRSFVNSVAFSPDKEYVLSGASDNTLILWNSKTGEVLQRYEGHTDAVNSVAFSPDGSQIVSGSRDGTVILWDTDSGDIIRRYEEHAESVNSVVFSPDGSQIVSGSSDGLMIVRRNDSISQLQQWILKNRYIPELTCKEREAYSLPEERQCVADIPPDLPTSQPTATPFVLPTQASPLMLDTPTPTRTPIPRNARLGENSGDLIVDGTHVWLYSGAAGQILNIHILISAGRVFTLELIDPNNQVIASGDSLIEEVRLPSSGMYQIVVRGRTISDAGSYRLFIEPN